MFHYVPIQPQQGWQCPVCNRVYSPSTVMCLFCPQPPVVTTTTTMTSKCALCGEDFHGIEPCKPKPDTYTFTYTMP